MTRQAAPKPLFEARRCLIYIGRMTTTWRSLGASLMALICLGASAIGAAQFGPACFLGLMLLAAFGVVCMMAAVAGLCSVCVSQLHGDA